MARRHFSYQGTGCPVEAALEIIGAKWKGGTVFHLLGGELRFSELRRRMPNVTQRILSKALKELEADGVVARTVYPAVPPQVGYRLTEKGESLRQAVLALAAFGRGHLVAEAAPACPLPAPEGGRAAAE
ncbi:winged helix-turn-helix transcriptional regulator [Xanthobacter tagetidis]|uniref:Transcriptional regulator n=1 Tax=Xanthobacter tagetidis TaxID=60216 RepID=A0A3L7AHM9_9HYPH|nr:helix-turn-helix domain-containing protein [Xanthobacter tagetidis]MBB6306291.1 DNA-binding HxlR family transcriptional regulator [Xanthobacter tagetidis]RLP79564.1 transcriptional regulator [Xanthobacter tagetidis]